MRKIRVMHTEWSQGWGGQEMRIMSEMNGFKASNKLQGGIEVECELVCKKGAKIADAAKEAGFIVHYLPFKGKFDLRTILALAKLLKERKIDILNSHSGIDTWCGILAAKLAGVKSVRTRHLSAPINSSRLNFINELADYIITTGEGVRCAMIANNRIKPQRIISIPTGIDESVFNPALYDKSASRAEFGLPKDALIIGSLGVLRSVKNQQMLLEAVLKLHSKHENICLVLAGDGPKKGDLQRFIDENAMSSYAKLLGHTSNPAKFLAALDIFALSSKNEGVPQALAQALFMHLPSLSSNVGSVSDLCDEDNFILYENNLDALISALDRLISNKSLLESMRKNPQIFVRYNFAREKMCEKIKAVYAKLLAI